MEWAVRDAKCMRVNVADVITWGARRAVELKEFI